MAKAVRTLMPNNEIRRLMLDYFYERNKKATSFMGKKGSATKISDVKADLKVQHGLAQQEVQSNLTYLLSQGWVEEKTVEKQVRARGGTVIPSVSRYYQITAAGIDKIEGPGEFTIRRFEGIRIEATGQNIIALGDGNEINAQFGDLGKALADLRQAITKSDARDSDKMDLVADIDTIQSQLAKPKPSRNIVSTAWTAVKTAAAIQGCASFVERASSLIAPFLL